MFAWKKFLPGKSIINASKLLKQYSTLAKQSGKSNFSIYSKLLKFQASPKFRQPASQPACLLAIRPGSARCRPPDFHRLCTVVAFLLLLWSTKKGRSLLKKVSNKVLIRVNGFCYDVTIKLYQHHVIKRVTHAMDTWTSA